MQGWIYIHDNHDKWPIRTFVYILILLDVVETCCSTQLLRHYLITNFGDFNALKTSTNLLQVDFLLTGAIMFLVHMFFARQLFLLTKSWWFPGFIVLFSVSMLGFGVSALPFQTPADALSRFRNTQLEIQIIVFHALSVFTDTLVTIGLSVNFSPGKTRFRNTKMILHRLLMYSITRGILIILVQVGHIVMYVVDPSNVLFWRSLHLMLSKLYVITTMVILNSRSSRREKLDEMVILDPSLLSLALSLSTVPSTADVGAHPNLDNR